MIKINKITQDELNTISQIERDCKKLHIFTPPKVTLTLGVFNKTGEQVIEQTQLSKTWNRNAYNYLCGHLMGINMNCAGTTFGAGLMPLKSYAGTTRQGNFHSRIAYGNQDGALATTASVTYMGIVVGTGTAAESFEGYVLTTPITHGTSAGTLKHVAQTAATVAYVSATKTFTATHRRSFDDDGGGDITVNEVAWYLRLNYDGSGNSVDYFMVSRDLLAAPVAVANTQRLTVDYTFSITFPA